ncbi:MAG: potassium transporter Kup, partial [Proteobacteria bacterium]|nr:potassium transporter Kup [Pseudomonadota bacterium]
MRTFRRPTPRAVRLDAFDAARQVVDQTTKGAGGSKLAGLALAAIGVVYGDIGTSPLYALQTAFSGKHAVLPTADNVLGILSLVFWSIMFVVSFKYVAFVLRADNKGEGSILSLMTLAQRGLRAQSPMKWTVLALGVFGAGMFYGDSVITPAVSVLSAVEGLEVLKPTLAEVVVPLTVAVLVGLFAAQRFGSGRVGVVFGPVMVLWFICIAAFGFLRIVGHPEILKAINPYYGWEFFSRNGFLAFATLGAVVLALTGAEALYADMGHFGRKPIRLAWFGLILPALVLNYFGQGALLLHDPKAADNPFYLLLPHWALAPMIVLATAATVIASQSVISGAYSMTREAIQLGLFPRSPVLHTSEEHVGQIYLPLVNWGLLVAVLASVLGFESSANLAAAYGIAVTGTMTITSVLVLIVARRLWHWPRAAVALVGVLLLTVDLAFFGANALKIEHGGWFPLVIGGMVFVAMTTWRRGRELLVTKLESGLNLRTFIDSIVEHPPVRVPGTAVFLTAARDSVPNAMLHNLKHNKVLHEINVILTVQTQETPRVEPEQRLKLEPLGNGFFRMWLRYGFAEHPHIPQALSECRWQGLGMDPMDTTYFLSQERVVAGAHHGMATWRDKLFAFMARNASPLTEFFR